MKCKICNKEFGSFKDLTTHLVKEHEYNAEQIYMYYTYSFETKEATCPICGEKFTMSWRQLKKHKDGTGRGITCGRKCAAVFMNLVYGNPSCREDVKEKKKQRALEKYGVENVFQAKEIQERSKRTNLKKRGVEYAMQSTEVKDKSKETNLERYGVEHVSQRQDIKKRKVQKSLKKYGVENISQAEEVKEKKRELARERYGVDYTLQAPEVRELGKKTNLEKYGVEYATQSEEVKEKIRETNLEKYGYEYVSQVPKIQEKMRRTNLKKYGNEYVIASEEVREKSKKTIEERYGVECFCQHKRCIEANGHRVSKINKDFKKLLESDRIESELEFIIENVGYDLKSGSTLIEINPTFTHNVTVGPLFGGKERKCIPFDYHLYKTNFAKEHGYSCIHVFDWDNWEKVLNILKNKSIIYARECEIKEITRKEADEFLGSYHLQGSTKQIQYAYGLYYNDKLVEVMTFGKPRYNKGYEYELLRLCSDPKVKIAGGASKILKHFEDQVKPKSIISYCDLSKFNGDVYKNLGFVLQSQTSPAKHWYNPKTKRHITDNLLRQRGFDQLHNTSFGKGTSNEQLMLKHGYVEIYDCGQLVFTKVLSDVA